MTDIPEQSTDPLMPAVPPRQPFLRRLPPIPFAVLTLVIVFALYQGVGGVITILLFGTSLTGGSVTSMRVATLAGQILFLLIPTILLARMRPPGPSYFFRWRMPDIRQLLLACAGVFALQQILQVYLLVQNAIPLPGPLQRLVDEIQRMIEETYRLLVTAHSPGELLTVILVAAVVPAICEELLFRGIVQRSLEQEVTGFQAALLTGVIFGAYHLSPFTIIPLAALGVYFGFIVYRTGNILIAMAAHFFNNFIACLAAYYSMDNDMVNIVPGDAYSPVVIAMNFFVFGVVFVGVMYYFIRITRPSPEPVG
jgi:uncharacterized protein